MWYRNVTDRRTDLVYQYRASVCWRTLKNESDKIYRLPGRLPYRSATVSTSSQMTRFISVAGAHPQRGWHSTWWRSVEVTTRRMLLIIQKVKGGKHYSFRRLITLCLQTSQLSGLSTRVGRQSYQSLSKLIKVTSLGGFPSEYRHPICYKKNFTEKKLFAAR